MGTRSNGYACGANTFKFAFLVSKMESRFQLRFGVLVIIEELLLVALPNKKKAPMEVTAIHDSASFSGIVRPKQDIT